MLAQRRATACIGAFLVFLALLTHFRIPFGIAKQTTMGVTHTVLFQFRADASADDVKAVRSNCPLPLSKLRNTNKLYRPARDSSRSKQHVFTRTTRRLTFDRSRAARTTRPRVCRTASRTASLSSLTQSRTGITTWQRIRRTERLSRVWMGWWTRRSWLILTMGNFDSFFRAAWQKVNKVRWV